MKSVCRVELRAKDRQQITAMLGRGRESARVLRRAMILRQLDRGEKIAEVAAHVGVSRKTVRAIGRCCRRSRGRVSGGRWT